MYSHLVLAITLSTNLATAQKPWQDFTIHQRTVLNPSGNNMTIPAPVFYNGTVADAPETNLDHIYYYGCGPVNKQQLANAVAYIRPAAQNLSDLVWAAPDEDPAARAALNAAFRYAFTTPDSVEYQHKVSNTFLAMAKGVTIDWDPPPGGSPRWSPTRNACIKGEPVYNNAAGAAWYSSVVFHNDANLLVRPFLNPSDDCPKWIISYANDRSTMTYVAHEMAHMGGASLEPEVYPLADILNSMFPGDAVNNAENYAFMLQCEFLLIFPTSERKHS